jgi:hypothetical protein
MEKNRKTQKGPLTASLFLGVFLPLFFLNTPL